MRHYYTVSGIFIILSIIDFALTAPVLVQEKRQASADVVQIPKNLITVLWERGVDEDPSKLVEWYRKGIKALNEQYELDYKSSVAHALSSAAPSRPSHGSTGVVQLPMPHPAPSTTNPYPVLESSRPWSPVQGDDESNWPENIPFLTEYGSNQGWMRTHAAQLKHLNPNKRPLTAPDPDVDWNGPTPKRPAWSKESGQVHEDQAEGHVQQMNSGSSTDSDFDENYWTNVEDPPPLGPASSKPSKPGPSNPAPLNPSLPTEPPSTEESTDPELNPDGQEPVRQAPTYESKGKAKELRRVSGTARDVANAAQRELQPTEKSLDPGE